MCPHSIGGGEGGCEGGHLDVKPPIKDTPKEDKPPNKGQTKGTVLFTRPPKEPLYNGQVTGSQACPIIQRSHSSTIDGTDSW